MSKKNKTIWVKLIANPGAGDVSEAASKIEQVTGFLIDAGQIRIARAYHGIAGKLTISRKPLNT